MVSPAVLYPLALPQAASQQGHLHYPSLPWSASTLFPESSLMHWHRLWHCTQTQETAYERFAQLPWALSDRPNLSHWILPASPLVSPPYLSTVQPLPSSTQVHWTVVNGLFNLLLGCICSCSISRTLWFLVGQPSCLDFGSFSKFGWWDFNIFIDSFNRHFCLLIH